MAKTYSCILMGIEPQIVEIETRMSPGFTGLQILGLPNDIVRDMKERIKSALFFQGFPLPPRKILVNVTMNAAFHFRLSRTPLAELDFAIAASVMRALAEKNKKYRHYIFSERELLAGELTLNGELKSLTQDLGIKLVYHGFAQRPGFFQKLSLPSAGKERHESVSFYRCLQDWLSVHEPEFKKCIEAQRKEQSAKVTCQETISKISNSEEKRRNFYEVLGKLKQLPQLLVGLLGTLCGFHHLLVAGAPGVGKSYTTQHIKRLLLPLTQREYLLSQLISFGRDGLERPYRSPHHSCSSAALVGGAKLTPGEVTLAQGGFLFLDELLEFSRTALESLREPMDNLSVTLSRSQGVATYPAAFQLLATANPCPCGYLFSKVKPCRCNPSDRRKYLKKLSGPLMDRFCFQIWIGEEKEKTACPIVEKLLQYIDREDENFFQRFYEMQGKKWDAVFQVTVQDRFPIFASKESRGLKKEEISCNAHGYSWESRSRVSFHQSLRSLQKLESIAGTLGELFAFEKKSDFLMHMQEYRILGSKFSEKFLFF